MLAKSDPGGNIAVAAMASELNKCFLIGGPPCVPAARCRDQRSQLGTHGGPKRFAFLWPGPWQAEALTAIAATVVGGSTILGGESSMRAGVGTVISESLTMVLCCSISIPFMRTRYLAIWSYWPWAWTNGRAGWPAGAG